jgi:Outer membrane protein beta-barrel domain
MTRKQSYQEPIKMQTPHEMNSLIRSLSTVTILAAAAGLGAVAAQAQSPVFAPVSPAMNFRAYMSAPANPAAISASDLTSFSSSSSSSADVDAPDPGASASASLAGGGAAGQPPPRRRYGRPSYADSHTNADGSAKYTFFGGGGFGLPTGGTHSYLTTGWGLQVGAGRNFNKKIGVDVEFNYDHFGFQNQVLNNLLTIYQGFGVPDGSGDGGLISQLGGTSHVWSFGLDPRYTFYDGDKYGAYALVGAGFYHKTANFTTPSIEEEETFFGVEEFQANQTIDDYTSNAVGVNAGVGMTYKFSRFTSERFYAEARYVYMANQARPFSLGAFGTSGSTAGPNLFPQNSAKTTYIPVKFGVRF